MNDSERDKMLIQIHGNIESIKKLVDQHHLALFGNGQPGLIKDLTTLITEFNDQEKYLDGIEKKVATLESRLSTVEKERAVATGKLDTGKAILWFIINFLISLTSIIIGILK